MSRKRFADTASFTRHCWECRHAKHWHKDMFSKADVAICELTGQGVEKYYSPNNQCSHLPSGCDYEIGGNA